MNNNKDSQIFSDTLTVGILYQTLLLFVEQSFVMEKTDNIRTLLELFLRFEASLTKEQKIQFRERLNTMVQEKTQQLAEELEKSMTPEDLAQLQEVLQSSQADTR